LEKAKSSLSERLDELHAWEAVHPGIDLRQAHIRLDDALRELNDMLPKVDDVPTNTLITNAPRFTTLAAAGKILSLKVQTVTAQWTAPGALQPVIDDLDAVDFPVTADGLEAYRKALTDVLNKHAANQDPQSAGAPMPLSAILSE
jgi:hypothetical protein